MPLLDPIPSPVEHADLRPSSGSRCSRWWRVLLRRRSGGTAILALRPSTDEDVDRAAASAHGRGAAAAGRAGFHSAGRTVRSHAACGEGADSGGGARSRANCRPWRGWLTMLPHGRRCCSRAAGAAGGKAAGLSELSAALTQELADAGGVHRTQRFSRMARWPTMLRRSWAAFGASRSGSSG